LLQICIPVIGASGGIAAVKVRAALLLWMLLQLIGALAQVGRGTAVAYAAHLGGGLTGLIFWSLYGRGETHVLRMATAGRR